MFLGVLLVTPVVVGHDLLDVRGEEMGALVPQLPIVASESHGQRTALMYLDLEMASRARSREIRGSLPCCRILLELLASREQTTDDTVLLRPEKNSRQTLPIGAH